MGSIVFLVGLIGLLPFVSAIVSFVQIRRLRQSLRLHEAIIASLSNQIAQLRTSQQPPQPTGDTDIAGGMHETGDHPLAVEAIEHEVSASEPSPASIVEPSFQHSTPTRDQFEMVIGGTWLTRIGAIAIVLGTLFFLKFAFDSGWITEPLRVLIGAAIGIGLVAGSERWRSRGLRVFAQGLAGAGIPILYLTVYSSYGFYGLVSQPVAFGLMGLVTCVTVFISLRHESMFISSMAAVGGMLTPALLSTGQMNTAGLFGYLIILFGGLLQLSYRRPAWWSVPLIGHVGVWAFWDVWFDARFSMSNTDHVSGSAFAIAFLFAGIYYQFLSEHRREDSFLKARRAINGIHVVLLYTIAIRALMSDSGWINSSIADALGVSFVMVAIHCRRKEFHSASSMYMVMGLFALDHAVFALDDGLATSIGLPALSILSVFVLHNHRRRAERLATIFVLIQGLVLASELPSNLSAPSSSFLSFLHLRMIGLAAIGCTIIVCSRHLFEFGSTGPRYVPFVRALGYLVILWCAHIGIFELCRAYDICGTQLRANGIRVWWNAPSHAIAALASVMFASVLIAARRLVRDESTLIAGLVGYGVSILWWFAESSSVGDPSFLPPFASVRTYTGAGIMIALLFTARFARLMTVLKSDVAVRSVIGGFFVVFSFVFMTIEVVWTEVINMPAAYANSQDIVYSSRLALDAWNRFHLRMSGTWIVYSIDLMVFGFVRRMRAARLGALVLLLITIIKVFLYDLSFLEQPYRIVSFIALGAILLIAGYMYQRFRSIILDSSTQ